MDDDPQARVGIAQQPQRGDPVEVRHAEVEDQRIGPQLAGLQERLAPVPYRRHHLMPRFTQHVPQHPPHDLLIVSDHHPHAYSSRPSERRISAEGCANLSGSA